jgi:hypothetical protein
MKLSYFFIIGSVIELVAGVILLTVFNNSMGYMGLIGSVLLMSLLLTLKEEV